MPPKPPKKPNPIKPSSPQQQFVKIKPSIKRFFYVTEDDLDLSENRMIPAYKFSNDHGIMINGFPYKKPNGYQNLYINGVMQQSSIYSITTKGVTITAVGGMIFKATPIIIEMVEFYLV